MGFLLILKGSCENPVKLPMEVGRPVILTHEAVEGPRLPLPLHAEDVGGNTRAEEAEPDQRVPRAREDRNHDQEPADHREHDR